MQFEKLSGSFMCRYIYIYTCLFVLTPSIFHFLVCAPQAACNLVGFGPSGGLQHGLGLLVASLIGTGKSREKSSRRIRAVEGISNATIFVFSVTTVGLLWVCLAGAEDFKNLQPQRTFESLHLWSPFSLSGACLWPTMKVLGTFGVLSCFTPEQLLLPMALPGQK